MSKLLDVTARHTFASMILLSILLVLSGLCLLLRPRWVLCVPLRLGNREYGHGPVSACLHALPHEKRGEEDMTEKHLLFIVNPVAGRKTIQKFIPQIVRIFMDAGYLVTTMVHLYPGRVASQP